MGIACQTWAKKWEWTSCK